MSVSELAAVMTGHENCSHQSKKQGVSSGSVSCDKFILYTIVFIKVEPKPCAIILWELMPF